MCYLAVKPGFSEQCRSIVGPAERKLGKLHNDAECTDGSQCQCDAFNWNSNDNDQLKAEMQCEAKGTAERTVGVEQLGHEDNLRRHVRILLSER